jgi:pimeloyl-ACP methyl ester carboxylesterase
MLLKLKKCKRPIPFLICQIVFFLPIVVFPQSQPLVGHWEGAYVRLGAVQTISVDFFVEGNTLRGKYDVPDLSIYDEPIRDLDVDLPRLKLRPKHGLFEMIVDTSNEEMTGINSRWNPPVTLHLKRKEKAPVNFTSEDVVFGNGNLRLAGRLFKPLKPGRYPAVVVVHGSGPQGISDNYYNFWGRFFASRGVAALIYDKRGVGRSTGDYKQANFEDLAGDALAAVRLLGTRKDLNPDQIGLFGISQGGWIAPLAASRSDAAKFLILNVGPSVTVEEQELHRVEYTLRAEDVPEDDIAEALEYTRLMFKVAYSGNGWEELEKLGMKLKDKKWVSTLSIPENQESLAGWKRIRFDPAPVLRRTTIPVLSIFGESDVLVPPKENAGKMERYLREAGNRDFTVRIIPNAGHDMESFGTLKGGEWKWPENYWVWPKKSTLFYDTITDWLSKREKMPN